ncbi:MAG: formimidoylglutamate deiminase [Acidimicrobiales bacterium]
MTTWWAERAWLGGPGTAAGVLLEEKDGRFVTVTPGMPVPPRGAERLQGLTLPGLANTHSHAFHRALRARTQDAGGTFWSWRDLMYRLAERLDPDGYRRLARAAYAEMALAGFTAVGELHYLHHGAGGVPYDDPNEMGESLFEAAAGAGVRLTLLDACYLRGGFDKELSGPQLRFGDGDAAGWAERVSLLRPPAHARVGAAIHSVRAVPPAAAAEVSAFARQRGWPLHAHVSEQRCEVQECQALLGRSPLGVLEAEGVLGPGFTAVHGTHFDADDVALLASSRGGCCVCPTTEADLGDGVAPAAALVSAGVALSFGTDSHAVVDGFEEARSLEMGSRLASERRGVLSASALLEAATAGGMAALAWDAGVLEAGRLADFVTVRLDSTRTAGGDPSLASTAVFAARAADVTDVVVGGRRIVAGGAHLLVADPAGELASTIGALWT